MFEVMMSFYILLIFVVIPKFLDLYYDAIYRSETEIFNQYLNEKCRATLEYTSIMERIKTEKWINYSRNLFFKSRGY